MAIRFDRIPLASAIFSSLWISPFLLNAQAAHVSGVRPLSAERAKPMDAPAPADFGSVNVGSTSSPMSITFTFDSSATLGSIAVLTQGAPNLDFTNAGTGTCMVRTAYSSGNTCTVDVTFSPALPGVRYGGAVLYDNSGNFIASAYIQGTGSAPQVNFLPGTESTFGDSSWTTSPCCVALDGAGDIYVSANSQMYELTPSGAGYAETAFNLNGRSDPFAIDGAGNFFVNHAYAGNGSVLYRETPSAGSYLESTVAGELDYTIPYPKPSVVKPSGTPAIDGSGDVFVTEYEGAGYSAPSGNGLTYANGPGVYSCGIYYGCFPSAVAVDASGNAFVVQFNVLPEEGYYPYVTEIEPPYNSSPYFPDLIGGGLNNANAIVANGRGDLYIADTGSSRIVKEGLSAGSYSQSVLPTVTSLNEPMDVAVDGHGNIYIADTSNNRYLKEDFSDPPAVAFSDSSPNPQVITIVNNGTAPLTFPAPESGNNPSISDGFALDNTAKTACPAVSSGSSTSGSIAPGASCTLTIDVAPGTFNGTLVLTDNNLNAAAPNYATHTISLSAVGVKGTPTIALAESAASLKAGQTLTLTATVTGVAKAGAPAPTGQVTFGSLLNGTVALNLSGVATWTYSSLPAGSYSISASYSGDSIYIAGASAPVSFTVARGSVNLAAVSGQTWTGTYGSTETARLCVAATDASGTNLSGVTVAFSGTGLTFSPSSPVTGTNGQACASVANSLTAGTYVASASAAGVPSVPTFNLTVQPAPLEIWASPNSISYGTAKLDFTLGKIIGLVNGDTIGGTVTVKVQCAATSSSPIGYYPVSVILGGSSGGDYAATVSPQRVHVRKALLQVFPYDLGVTYGQTPVLPNRYFFKGLVNGDTAAVVSGAPTFATTVTSTTPVGIYRVTSSVGTLSTANYDFVMMENILEVYKAPLTLTANNVTMQQGSAVPPLTYTVTGFMNGDAASVVTGTPILTTTATSSSSPGTYPITVSAGTLSAENYGVVNYGPAATVTVLP